MEKLELMNEETPVLTFSYDVELHRTGEVFALENPAYAPVSIIGREGCISDKELDWWWRHRPLPASRAHLRFIEESLGLDSLAQLLESNLALSLSDRYWVRPVGSGLEWDEVNFFDNGFTDNLGALTLEPCAGGAGQAPELDLMNPSSTVGGNVPKKWAIDVEGRRVLLKAGTQLFDQDVYNEVVAADLYRLCLPPGRYAPYGLVDSGSRVFCRCENFLGPHEEYVSCADVLRRFSDDKAYGRYGHCVSALESVSGLPREVVEHNLSIIFSLDALLSNFDRHTGNFGLIRDCRTLEYRGFAPLFDAGSSLWCDKRRLEAPSDYDYTPRPFTGYASGEQWRQLKLFSDYTWLDDLDFLGTWKDGAIEVLGSNPLMSEERVYAIERGIDLNILNFERHVGRMGKLYPSLSWAASPQKSEVEPLKAETFHGTSRQFHSGSFRRRQP